MFTGLIEHSGTVVSREESDGGARFVIRAPTLAPRLTKGDSVAVNGVCLTVTARDDASFAIDAVATTLARTTLTEWERGREVNLEPALRVGDELGGHLVQGHVDGVGEVVGLLPEGNMHRLRIGVGDAVAAVTVDRGSLAIDGVSLTVADLADGIAEFAIIPYTWTRTTLRGLAPGARVNVEADLIGKYVARLVAPYRETSSPGAASPGDLPGSSRTDRALE